MQIAWLEIRNLPRSPSQQPDAAANATMERYVTCAQTEIYGYCYRKKVRKSVGSAAENSGGGKLRIVQTLLTFTEA